MLPSRIVRPLMALGLATATITGGLLIQPQNTDQELAATPASLSTERITLRAAPPSSSSPTGAEAAITVTPSPARSATVSPTPEQTPVLRSSGERSPLNAPSSGESSPSSSASPQRSSGNSVVFYAVQHIKGSLATRWGKKRKRVLRLFLVFTSYYCSSYCDSQSSYLS